MQELRLGQWDVIFAGIDDATEAEMCDLSDALTALKNGEKSFIVYDPKRVRFTVVRRGSD